MKLPTICGALVLGLLTSCAAESPGLAPHWRESSIGPRVTKAFLSYEWERDGSYRDFQWEKKQDINLTLRRHFFNHNPENPFQADDPTVYAPRPNHSILPRPWNYIHLEGIAMGAIIYAGGGMFIPVPVDSLLGTFEEGGDDEFMAGVGETFRPIGVVTASFLHDALNLPETRGDGWRR